MWILGIWKRRLIGLLGITLWQGLRMYDVSGKLLNGIKSKCEDNLAYLRLKNSESECFRTSTDVTQGYIMSPLLLNVFMTQ